MWYEERVCVGEERVDEAEPTYLVTLVRRRKRQWTAERRAKHETCLCLSLSTASSSARLLACLLVGRKGAANVTKLRLDYYRFKAQLLTTRAFVGDIRHI